MDSISHSPGRLFLFLGKSFPLKSTNYPASGVPWRQETQVSLWFPSQPQKSKGTLNNTQAHNRKNGAPFKKKKKKLDHGWPESRTSQARSAQRCIPTRSICEASETAPGKVLCANWSVQVGLRKLLYASCTVQVALRKLLCASCSGKLVPASGSLQVVLCKLRSLQVALCKLLCASCSAQVALRKLLCASCSRQGALRKLVGASWSAQVALCNLLCASCSAQVALKCKLHLATPARGPGRNRTRDPPVPGAGARTTRQLPRTSSNNKSCKKPRVFAPRPRRSPQRVAQKSQKTSSFCTSTTPIPTEGRAGMLEIAKNHGFLHLDHADPRRGSRGHVGNRKKTMSFCTSTTPIPAEGRAGMLEIAKNHGFLHLDHADPRAPQKSQKKHGFLHLDHADPRRGSIFV